MCKHVISVSQPYSENTLNNLKNSQIFNILNQGQRQILAISYFEKPFKLILEIFKTIRFC